MIVELARRVSSCGWVPCASGDELASLGFRVGNPSAIGWHQPRIFQHPCYPKVLSRQRAEELRRAVCAEKWPEAQAEQEPAARPEHRKGQKPSPAAGWFFPSIPPTRRRRRDVRN